MDFIYDYNLEVGESFGGKESSALPAQPTAIPTIGIDKDAINTFAKLSLGISNSLSSGISNFNNNNSEDLEKKRGSILSEKLNKVLNNPSILYNSFGSLGSTTSLNGHDNGSVKNGLEILESGNLLKTDVGGKSLIDSGISGFTARRKLKMKITNDYYKEQLNQLKKLEPVYQSLKQIDEHVKILNSSNKKIEKDFENLHESNVDKFKKNENLKISNLNNLIIQKDLVEIKKNLLIAFQKKFQLNQYEKFLLESSNDIDKNPVDYFNSYKKAETIYNDCFLLLSLKNPEIGLSIMKNVQKLLDTALNNMNFYVKQKFSKFSELKNIDFQIIRGCIYLILNSVKKEDLMIQENDAGEQSLADVVDSSTLLHELFTNIITIKSKLLVSEFDSIVHESSRQLYSQVYNPSAYVGDLLASVHSLIMSEKEMIEYLLDPEEENSDFKTNNKSLFETGNMIKFQNDIIDLREVEKYILNKIISSLATPLKLRLEQVIRSNSDMTLINSLYDSLDLYKLMFGKQLDESLSTSILATLNNLQSLLREKIFIILKERQDQIITEDTISSIDNDLDLQPPDWLIDYMNNIQDILHNLSINAEFMNLKSSAKEFDDFLSLMIDKPLTIINNQLSKNIILSEQNSSVIKINCLDFVSSKILTIDTLLKKYDDVHNLLLVQISLVTNNVYHEILINTKTDTVANKMDSIYDIIRFYELHNNKDTNTEESKPGYAVYEQLLEDVTVEKLQHMNNHIESFIPEIMSHFEKLYEISSPLISTEITDSAFLKFTYFYSILYSLLVIYFDNNEIEQNIKILRWNDIEMATLLGVEKKYLGKGGYINNPGESGDILSPNVSVADEDDIVSEVSIGFTGGNIVI